MRSLKFTVGGTVVFIAFVLLFLVVPHDEANLLTRVVVFFVLIPPPVCFAAGVAFAFHDELRRTNAGAWINVAAILLHGILAIVILQQFLA